jgi:hypothetical protein
MFFTPELQKRIIDAFNAKAGVSYCSLCQNKQFTVADGFATIQLHDAYPTFLSGGGQSDRAIPCAALVCTRCGNTFLVNLLTLGFGKELEAWENEFFPPRRW